MESAAGWYVRLLAFAVWVSHHVARSMFVKFDIRGKIKMNKNYGNDSDPGSGV